MNFFKGLKYTFQYGSIQSNGTSLILAVVDDKIVLGPFYSYADAGKAARAEIASMIGGGK